MKNKPLLVITGPTASGKSSLAMDVARKYGGEIICADSRTVYKGMDIGTAKPTAEDQREVKHHLLDIVCPDEKFTVVEFKRRAVVAIEDIMNRGKLPIIVGGTGLYVDAVVFDYQFNVASGDDSLRKELSKKTADELIEICKLRGYELPTNLSNKRHLIRVIETCGEKPVRRELRDNTLIVAVCMPKGVLRDRIRVRILQMGEEGVVSEAAQIANRYGWCNEAMKGNIYRLLEPVVNGTMDFSDIVDKAVKSDMMLVKRQLTWFKRNPSIIWGDVRYLEKTIEQFISTQC